MSTCHFLCAYIALLFVLPQVRPHIYWYMAWQVLVLILLVEVEIPSLKILSQTELSKAEWACSQYEQLNMIDEKHMTAICHRQLYQRRVEWASNKKVRPRVFEEGDLVLKKRNQAMPDHRGKFAPTYEGPYMVKKAFSRGALILADMD